MLLQAVVALVRSGEWDGSKPELFGYLAVSAVLVPGGLFLTVEERSRWGTLVLAAACLTLAVVVVRLRHRLGSRCLSRRARLRASGRGAGRLLVAVYAVFALSASSRAALQLATEFDRAPVAYLLSAVAAAVYLVATVALWRGARRLA